MPPSTLPDSASNAPSTPPVVTPQESSTPERGPERAPRRVTPKTASRWRARLSRDTNPSETVPEAREPDRLQPVQAGRAFDRLRSIARPRLEDLVFRLRIARHHSLIDDRIDEMGTLRFRLVPRSAPFDERPPVPGSVLELVAAENVILARFWLDPVAERPSSELEVAADAFGEEWLDGVIVDFVARSLRQE